VAQSVQVQKVNWWHERLADLMIARPDITLGEIARLLNKSQVWISIVKNSDVFQDYWHRRSLEHSAVVTHEVKAKGFAATELALDAILAKLEFPEANGLTTETLLDIVDVNMKRFGYAPSGGPSPPVINFNLGAVTPEQLAEARERLRARDGAVDVAALPARGADMPAIGQNLAPRGDLAPAGIERPGDFSAALGPEIGPTNDPDFPHILPKEETPS
jgi:hypothetical protein